MTKSSHDFHTDAGVASPAFAFVSSASRISSRPPFTKRIATALFARAGSTKIAGAAVSSPETSLGFPGVCGGGKRSSAQGAGGGDAGGEGGVFARSNRANCAASGEIRRT